MRLPGWRFGGSLHRSRWGPPFGFPAPIPGTRCLGACLCHRKRAERVLTPHPHPGGTIVHRGSEGAIRIKARCRKSEIGRYGGLDIPGRSAMVGLFATHDRSIRSARPSSEVTGPFAFAPPIPPFPQTCQVPPSRFRAQGWPSLRPCRALGPTRTTVSPSQKAPSRRVQGASWLFSGWGKKKRLTGSRGA